MEATAQAAPWVVLKFGGTSVHNRASWERVMGIIDRHHAEGRRVMVVCSAMRGVSDALDALCGMPPSSQALLQRIADAHLAWIKGMGLAEAMPVWEAAFPTCKPWCWP
jgi:bifunctional diaminopimelate decarboxylase / aspartate kinase